MPIDISEVIRFRDTELWSLFRECTPKILVVTDGLNYDAGDGFGLSQFVDTLKGMTIHGMTPTVVQASRTASNPGATLLNFKFDDAGNGVRKSRYDMVFLFGIQGEANVLAQTEVDALARFMQDGGGVFATGDHEDLGAGMGRDVPRVRSMRLWRMANTPDNANPSRLTTNLSGGDGRFAFEDQSDVFPQRLYANYRTAAGGVGLPHPLVQIPFRLWPFPIPFFEPKAVDVFPDHPHEGECVIPSNLATTFPLDGVQVDEWPAAIGGGSRISPETAAMTMSFGDGFTNKEPVAPRSFIAIAGYDGHRAGVGRVVTDATWHHFVNINLDGTGAGFGLTGLQNPLGVDTPELTKIRRYYKNIALWLMPTSVRRCLRFPWWTDLLVKYPLIEEFRPIPLPQATGKDLHEMGTLLVSAMSVDQPPFVIEDLLHDALEDALGEGSSARLLEHGPLYGVLSGREFAIAALGAQLAATVDLLREGRGKKSDADLHKKSEVTLAKAARTGVGRFAEVFRGRWTDLEKTVTPVLKRETVGS